MTNNFYSENQWGSEPTRSFAEQREKKIINYIQKRLNTSVGTALDIGCGDGFFLNYFHNQFPNWSLTGIDGSKSQLKKAENRKLTNEKVKFQFFEVADRLPFEDQTFDFIMLGEVIEHLVDPDKCVQECYRLLKPNGVFVVTTPNLFSWYNRVLMFFGVSPLFIEYSTNDSSVGYGILKKIKFDKKPVGHLRIFHPEALIDLLSLYNFKDIKIEGACFEPLPHKIKFFDKLLANIWPRGASLLISFGKKSNM